MAVTNFKNIKKANINTLIETALKDDCIVCHPLERFNHKEIKELSELAKENDIVLTISTSKDNFYAGTTINLVKRSSLLENQLLIKYI